MKKFLLFNLFNYDIHIIKTYVCSIKFLKPLFLNKSEDEKSSVIACIFSITLFEVSVIFEIIKLRKLLIPYILLSISMLLFPTLFYILIKVYEVVLLKNPEFILYQMREGDNIRMLSEEFFPECTCEKVCKIIIAKNKLSKPPMTGDLILIPIKKERKVIKIPFFHQRNF